MHREIEKYLLDWKNNPRRKPLIIRGARQVGKTYTIDKFAKENYKNYLKINLEQDIKLKTIFENNNPKEILENLSVLFNIPFIANETLLFIDEIQVQPKAIVSLRYFYEQMPEIHIIVAGSLLDFTLNQNQYSMPVGRVEFAYMYPLNFKEFLTSLNENTLVEYINNFDFDKNFSQLIHSRIGDLLRLYFFIGGMPEAVSMYVETRNLIEVEKIHSNIITSIEFDFAKYGTRKQQDFLRDILHYCATNIGRKVKYVNINKNVSSSQLKDALLRLETSRIIHLVRNTQSANVPITQHQDNDVFKPLFMDIGLLNHIAKIKLTDLNDLLTDYEGVLSEQFVGQELIANSDFYDEQKLNYWLREAKNSNAEIDFLFQIGNNIFPIEVKAGKHGTLKSLNVFMSEKNKSKGIRLNMDLPSLAKDLDIKVNLENKNELKYDLYSFPLYFAGFLKNFKIK